ncbi:MAG: serine/threonine protein kinase [Wenzhouxiangella sp.]|nr:serine/threonine protein kinase [Wenzhouxiangella sp.]
MSKRSDRDPDSTEVEQTRLFSADPTEKAGKQGLRLAGFRIERELGRGGMGQVFLARQLEPVERDVAIKVILQQMRNPATEQRFLVERQALAQMYHPAIAQIFDAGKTADGFPYFVMEYVPGQPLDRFCAEHRLSLHERLKLFIKICQGVQHAHQKGIIHRDLKPANVLVSWVDGVPVPKIIDFGIATAAFPTQSRDSESSAGTPMYMSPELFGDQVSIDTRSDIYSLGVMLYELLCDQRPYPRELFKNPSALAIRDAMARHQPGIPSQLVRSAGEHGQAIAERRRTTLRRLEASLREDLDAIAAMAVHPDREHRYASGTELIDEIWNYLDGRPVRAMGEAHGYRLRRFAGRNKLLLASLGTVIIGLGLGLGLAVYGMFEAQRQQALAEQRQSELERVVSFQQSMLGGLDPRAFGEGLVDGLRRQYLATLIEEADDLEASAASEAFEAAVGRTRPTDLARELIEEFMLQRAVTQIESDFIDQPLVQADLFQSVLEVYRSTGMVNPSLDLAERIVELRESELGPNHASVLEARLHLARALFEAAQFSRARGVLDIIIARADSNDRRLRELRFQARNQLVFVLVESGERAEAIGVAQHNMDRVRAERSTMHMDYVQALNTLGYAQARSGDVEAALESYQQSLELARQLVDSADPAVYGGMLNLSAALGQLGRHDEALALEVEALDILTANLGRRNQATLRLMNNLGLTYLDLGRHEEASQLLEETHVLRLETLGPDHPLTLRTELNLGRIALRTGNPEAALQRFTHVAAERERQLGNRHRDTLNAFDQVIRAQLALNDTGHALELALELHQLRLEVNGPSHPAVLASSQRIAELYQELDEPELELEWRHTHLDGARDGALMDRPEALASAIRKFALLVNFGQLEPADRLAREIRGHLDRGGAELQELREAFNGAVRLRLQHNEP